jgi:beta-glucosidase
MKKLAIVVLFVMYCTKMMAQDYKKIPFWNDNLPFEKRVDDLIGRLTLDEKVHQMINAAPAIPRLGIPAYDWWNETLHGVARTPFKVTVYPQAIGMAATWDQSSLAKMAQYSAIEGRAIFNKATRLGRNNERYMGLTYWTPNINIFRDPRWGRGQETYGEDPHLTATLGNSFVKSLQGSDPKYLLAAACAKHFAVHSGPEPSRHVDDFTASKYDLWDTYLPAFENLVLDAKVAGVMCAYNRVAGQPCCGSDLLMNDILKNKWKFGGYVTSDCWGIEDFFKYHKTHPDATSAASDALMHGTDIECGTNVYYSLKNAVENGTLKESQVDASLKRLFMIRMRLGMFDPIAKVKYAQTPETVLEAPEHKAHSLKMAQQSIVLLKNDHNTLPLNKNTIKKIAVIGPNADNRIAVLGNYNGQPSEIVTALKGIENSLAFRSKQGKAVEVVYDKAVNFVSDSLLRLGNYDGQFTTDGKTGFKAEYFNNKELKGSAIVRYEAKVDNFWQEGQNVVEGIKATDFSARYTATFSPDADGLLTFEVEGDDGYRFYINDKEVLAAWLRNRWGARTYRLQAKKGEQYQIKLEYWQGEGKANIRLGLGAILKSDFDAIAASVADADAIVYVGGISPQLEGEEMRVDFEGFAGGDRTSILLPKVQTELMKKLKQTGKPLVFVMMTGSAIATPWENQNADAILNAWYGGESAGTAIANVLFGDYNPAGRLPVTFYRSDTDLPDFKNYDMTGRTYRYFKGEAAYPFGHGLSYSNFTYSNITLPASIKPGKAITVTATVKNTGKMTGEEVAQLYLAYPGVAEPAPIRALKGYKRFMLKPGQSQALTFVLSPKDLKLIKQNGEAYQPKGTIEISVGGGQPKAATYTTSNVLTKTVKVL